MLILIQAMVHAEQIRLFVYFEEYLTSIMIKQSLIGNNHFQWHYAH